MDRKGGLVLAALVAALVLLQRYGLDPQPEKRLEDRYTKIAEMPAGDIVPTYVASLFFGAFRAAVIDILWIQLKRVEDERRWYERREIVKMISYFQPRNPEVWSHLGWHSAYNVANGFTDPDKSWEWVRFGLTWLRQGNRMLPDSPHLKMELGYTLLHKPSWSDGKFDLPLLERIEADAELQELLQDRKPQRRLSAFELAIPWFERAREDLARVSESGISKTQMGLMLYQSTMDGYIRQCLYYQGIYLWRYKNEPEEAKKWFRRAEEHTRKMLRTVYPERYVSPIFEDRAVVYSRMPALVDLEARARAGGREDQLAFLREAQPLLVERGLLDEGFLWSRHDREAPLSAVKRALSRDRDPQECNDSFEMAAYAEPGRPVLASVDPEGLDTDYFWFERPAPRVRHPEDEPPPPPPRIPVTLEFNRPETARLDLKVTVFDRNRVPLATAEIRGKGEVKFDSRHYGDYYLKIEPLSPPSPWPDDTRYGFRIRIGS